jgi:hypothetical protein
MIKLINILKKITEGKQVGTLYHFTSLNGLYGILKDGFIKPNYEGQISTTRNKNIIDISAFFEYNGGQVTVILELDGDKISNNYKIKPYYHDEDTDPSERNPAYMNKYEFEEQIVTNGKNFPIFPYLKNVSITIDNKRNLNKKILSQTIELLKEKNIPYEIK